MILEKKIDFFRHSRLKNFISDMHLNTCVCLTDVLIIDSHYKSCVSLCTENGLEDDSSSVDSFRGAVPQTSLLDTSANRDKGQLVSAANRNRRPPTKRNIKVIRQIYLPGPLTKQGVSLLVISWRFYICRLVLLILTCLQPGSEGEPVEEEASESGLETWIKHDRSVP